MKTCSKCFKRKPTEEFYLNPRYTSGRQSYCKACDRAYKQRWKSTPHGNALQKASTRKLRTGCSADMWKAAWVIQNGLCGICSTPLDTLSRTPHADHCHTTKRVRGILCNNCNQAIGYFKDNASRCRAAAEYLDNPPFFLVWDRL